VPDPGGAAFYGPKISVQVKDALGRSWQMSTIQLDFNMPDRFELEYTAADGTRKRPVLIHRALFGSIERFFGVLTEHYAGAFPAWLAPVQARVVTVSERFDDWAAQAHRALDAAGFRVELDRTNDKLGAKIRSAQLDKIPFTLVVGEKEVAVQGVAPRRHGGEDLHTMPLQQFIELLRKEAAPPY